MLHDKNKEIDGMNKEFQRQIQILVEDHRKEVDVSIFFKLIFYYLSRQKDNLNCRPRGKRLRLYSRPSLAKLYLVIALSEYISASDGKVCRVRAGF